MKERSCDRHKSELISETHVLCTRVATRKCLEQYKKLLERIEQLTIEI